MHGIAYDEVADRIIVPAQFSQAILSFRGDAKGEEPPVRTPLGRDILAACGQLKTASERLRRTGLAA